MYFMLKSLVTHQLLQSVTNLYLVWGVRHMSEFLVSPCFPYFLKSCISSKRQGKQIVLIFLWTPKKYSLDYGKDTCVYIYNVWIKNYVWIMDTSDTAKLAAPVLTQWFLLAADMYCGIVFSYMSTCQHASHASHGDANVYSAVIVKTARKTNLYSIFFDLQKKERHVRL